VKALQQLSAWLERATNEGRAALHSLRASATEKNELAEAFRRAIDECGASYPIQASFEVTGGPRELHPIVRDEVYRIGYEAIRNACMHSRGTRAVISLRYSHDLVVRVSDDGAGIAPAVLNEGRPGHFGLQGMRERAARIGAALSIRSSVESGTEVCLTVPGHLIFTPPASRRR
jgi:signal transduction histidine kinase